MLRLLVVVLALANVGYFLWTQGGLALLGLGPVSQSEAFRLNQQIRPEAMRLLTDTTGAAVPEQATASTAPDRTAASAAASAASASAAAAGAVLATRAASNPASSASAAALPSSAPSSAPLSAPGAPVVGTPLASSAATAAAPDECLQAGLFTEAQANALRARLQASLPEGSWALSRVVEPPRWIIYMGRYDDESMVAKKRNELRARGVYFEPVQNQRLNPGLSLGHFTTKPDAERELAKDAERGVRTARVIQERGEVRGQRLVLPAASAAVKAQMVALRRQLAGRALTACS